MIRNQSHVFTLSLITLYALSAVLAAEGRHTRHLRTTDRWLRSLVDDGVRASPTFRTLVARIERSDIIVYLKCDPEPPTGVDGRLTFVTAAGGYRYLMVRLRRRVSTEQQLAIMAHELQHAIEIADSPAITDPDSMAREYRNIGYVNIHSATPGISFDTHEAIYIGNQVHRELLGTAAAD